MGLSILAAVDPGQILLADEMRLVTNGRVLRDPSVKISGTLGLSNKLNPEPSITVRFEFGQRF